MGKNSFGHPAFSFSFDPSTTQYVFLFYNHKVFLSTYLKNKRRQLSIDKTDQQLCTNWMIQMGCLFHICRSSTTLVLLQVAVARWTHTTCPGQDLWAVEFFIFGCDWAVFCFKYWNFLTRVDFQTRCWRRSIFFYLDPTSLKHPLIPCLSLLSKQTPDRTYPNFITQNPWINELYVVMKRHSSDGFWGSEHV